jgi:WD40 repeat protein
MPKDTVLLSPQRQAWLVGLEQLWVRFRDLYWDTQLEHLFVEPATEPQRIIPGVTEEPALTCMQAFVADAQSHSMVLLGDPGLGKSTILKWFAYCYWVRLLDEKRQRIREDLPADVWIPLYISLVDITTGSLQERLLEDYYERVIQLHGAPRGEMYKQGKLLLLLDGFDELPVRTNLMNTNKWSRLFTLPWKVVTSCRSEVLLHREDWRRWFQVGEARLFEVTLLLFNQTRIEHYLQQHTGAVLPNAPVLPASATMTLVHDVTDEKMFSDARASLSPAVSIGTSASQEDDWRDWRTYYRYLKKVANLLDLGSNLVKKMLFDLKVALSLSSATSTLASQEDDWHDWRTYYRYLEKTAGLLELASNPFVLRMLSTTLPKIAKKLQAQTEEAVETLTRQQAYECFIEGWFEYQVERIHTQRQLSDIPAERLATYLWHYAQQLALLRFQEGRLVGGIPAQETLNPVLLHPNLSLQQGDALAKYKASYAQDNAGGLLEQEKTLEIIRSGCLLKTGAGEFHFLHKSLIEFFAARHLFSGLSAIEHHLEQITIHSPSAILDEKRNDNVVNSGMALSQAVTIFSSQLIIDEVQVIQNLADYARRTPHFRQLLLELIESSRYPVTGADYALAASNAMTILCAAGENFSGKDLSRVRLPGANCAQGFFDHANFTEAHLPKIRFSRAWLRAANFTGADLDGLVLGQQPSYQVTGELKQLFPHFQLGWLAVSIEHNRNDRYIITLIALVNNAHQSMQPNKSIKLKGKGAATSMVLNPAGSLLMVGFKNGDIRFATVDWSQRRAQWGASLVGHSDRIRALSFSPNGKLLASGDEDKTVRLWDVTSQHLLVTFEGGVSCLAFSPGNKLLASGSSGGTVRLWDVVNQRLLDTLVGNILPIPIKCLVFSPDGKLLASALILGDKSVCLWDIASQRLLATLVGHKDFVNCLAFSSDSKLLASSSNSGAVCLWDVTSQRLLTTLAGYDHGVSCLAFSLDGKVLASSSTDNTVRLWDVANQFLSDTLVGRQYHSIRCSCQAFSPDGNLLALGSSTAVRLRNAVGQRLSDILVRYNRDVNYLIFSPDGKLLALSSTDDTVRLWDVVNQCPSGILARNISRIKCLVFSSDGKLLASSSADKTVRLWDIASRRLLGTLTRHDHDVNYLIFSPNGKLLASGGHDDEIVRLWDVTNRRLLAMLDGHIGWVNHQFFWGVTVRIRKIKGVLCLAFSPSSNLLASGGKDKTVRLWDIGSQRLLATLVGHDSWIKLLTFSPSGDLLASASGYRWASASGYLPASASGYLPTLGSGDLSVFVSDGDLLVSSSKDNTIHLWDVVNRRLLAVLTGHDSVINHLAFSPSGNLLASSSEDNTVRLWQITDSNIVRCVAILPYVLSITILRWQNDANLLASTMIGNVLHWQLVSPDNIGDWQLIDIHVRHYPLTCHETILDSCVGLSAANHRLFQQLGAVGEPSRRPPARIRDTRTRELIPGLDYHSAIFPLAAPPMSLLSQGKIMNYEQWLVHLVRKPQSSDPSHVFILLEGVNAYGKAFFLRYELVTSGVAKGFARIRRKDNFEGIHTSELDEKAREGLLEVFIGRSERVALSWTLTREQGLRLINTIEDDMSRNLPYSSRGGSASHLRFYAEADVCHNCFTWAREKLRALGDEVIDGDLEESVLDKLVAHPKWHVVQGVQSGEASNCPVM